MNTKLIALLFISALFQCRGKNANVDSTQSNDSLYFHGNMENVTMDREHLYGWKHLEKVPEFRAEHMELDGDVEHVNAYIKTFENKKVLYAEVNNDDPNRDGQTRFQWEIYLAKKLEIIHFKYRMYLSPDIADLNNYPNSIQWFSLFEMWNERGEDLDGNSGSARWNLNIHKDETSSLYWEWESEYMQPDSLAFHNLYPDQRNKIAEIPLGRWFELDIFFNRNGKTTVKVDNNTIFDFIGQNMYPGKPELYPGYNGWNIGVYKIYTSDEVLDWMNHRNKKIWSMYEDFKWFRE